MENNWYLIHADLTLKRLSPRILAPLGPEDSTIFARRLTHHFPTLFEILFKLYGSHYDFLFHVENILTKAAGCFAARPQKLKQLDAKRLRDPNWFQQQSMMGAVCYVDRFAGSLSGLRSKLDYLKELGITYLHLMPLFECPPERNDGGYAVSSFRRVNPLLGTMDELSALSDHFRENGISLVLDFVFNHTSDEHEWAKRALAGDKHYQAYFRMFDDRTLPDAYEANLREIFPEQAPGSFTWRPEIQKWVWTTFFNFQWDLNYENPEVFAAMLEEMMFLANQGIEVLRLDAVPFIWKRLGTNCENLPEAHLLIRAFNALMQICAPALLFKSEAIVHPRDVQSYISTQECQISYNPILMVCLWDAMATRDTKLMQRSMQKRFELPANTAWVNYIRSHDDIGWGFADEDAAEVGIKGADHRYFLNRFYTGSFPGSFARGVPFNYNPRTQDMRISGTTASLAGLEEALERNDPVLIEYATRRLLLCQAIVLSVGGIPLIYLGDEIAMRNDYTYLEDPHLAEDSRWIHRPKHDWSATHQRHSTTALTGRIFRAIARMIHLRKTLPALSVGETRFVETSNAHIFAFFRHDSLLVIGNFSDTRQVIDAAVLFRTLPIHSLTDLLSSELLTETIALEPWQIRWIKRSE